MEMGARVTGPARELVPSPLELPETPSPPAPAASTPAPSSEGFHTSTPKSSPWGMFPQGSGWGGGLLGALAGLGGGGPRHPPGAGEGGDASSQSLGQDAQPSAAQYQPSRAQCRSVPDQYQPSAPHHSCGGRGGWLRVPPRGGIPELWGGEGSVPDIQWVRIQPGVKVLGWGSLYGCRGPYTDAEGPRIGGRDPIWVLGCQPRVPR